MTFAIIALAIVAALCVWSAMTTCSLAGFVPKVSVTGQLRGPAALGELATALLDTPGVRLLERTDDELLVGVMPVPSSMERGYGLFAVVRRTEDGVVLLDRGRLPVAPGLDTALRQLERDARMRVTYG